MSDNMQRVIEEQNIDNTRGGTQRVIQENTINNMRGGTKRVYVIGGGQPEKYAMFSRVKDDSNNEIGTVCGYHTDANNQKYAVVALDAQYRNSSGQYLSSNVEVTGLEQLADQTVWENTDTATSNCNKILQFASDSGYTSTAATHCRSKSFVIEGTTYYGQLPTIVELTDVFRHRTAINNADTSASQYSSLIVPSSATTWSSSQYSSNNGWFINYRGNAYNSSKNATCFVLPILEIPID